MVTGKISTAGKGKCSREISGSRAVLAGLDWGEWNPEEFVENRIGWPENSHSEERSAGKRLPAMVSFSNS